MIDRLIIVTGASRGIGASLAIESSKKYNENTLFLLIARDLDKLEKVRSQMTSQTNRIRLMQMDFSRAEQTVDELEEKLKLAINDDDSFVSSQIKELIVFYNHGTLRLDTVERVATFALQEFQVNVTSVWLFLAAIRKLFPLNMIRTQFHVNISSLLATKFHELFSIYSSSKNYFSISLNFNLINQKKMYFPL